MEDPKEKKDYKANCGVFVVSTLWSLSWKGEKKKQEEAGHRANKYGIGSYSLQHIG